MKIAIMQPYLFPYIGYWQLINAVDKFVLLDDVNYITRGYINRNTILLNGEPFRFSIPIKKASQNKLIKDTELSFDAREKDKFLRMLEMAYKKAECFDDAMPIISRIVNNEESDLTKYAEYGIREIAAYIGINTQVLVSSQIEKNPNLKGQERIIEICRRLDASIYVNPSGGRKLYDREKFEKDNIQLRFIDSQMDKIIYKQCQNKEFIPNLSIIDILMNIPVHEINKKLQFYELNIR